jgi:hypothetical protein
MQKEEKKRPDYETRLNGIRLAVWANETDGRLWYSAAPSRRVVEAGSNDARYYSTFNGVADLVLLREAIDQAIAWINQKHGGRAATED